jgi:hypothetical protein
LSSARIEWSNELMNPKKFCSALLVMVGLASTSAAADYAGWVAQGYRWSGVDGPYAFIKEQDAKNEASYSGKKSVSDTIGRAYFLRRGKVVLVVETDAASGLSKIHMGGVASDLWIRTKYLSTRPLRNTLGEIETPDTASILPISSATPSPSSSAKPAASASPSPTAKSAK